MQIDWWTVALQTINFLIVIWLLQRLLYRPVRRMIENREAADRAAADAAREKAKTADAMKAEYEARIAAFEDQRRTRQAELHKFAQAEKEKLLDAARQEAETIRTKAREEVEAIHKRARKSLREEIAALAKDLANHALRRTPPDPGACLAATLDQQPETAWSRMRSDLANGGTATLVTAKEQSEQDRRSLTMILRDRFGSGTKVVFEADADLLGGVILRLPHGVIDASVSGRLDEAADCLEEVARDS